MVARTTQVVDEVLRNYPVIVLYRGHPLQTGSGTITVTLSNVDIGPVGYDRVICVFSRVSSITVSSLTALTLAGTAMNAGPAQASGGATQNDIRSWYLAVPA